MQLSLLGKILLSTSLALTVLFGGLGWWVQHYIAESTAATVEEEVRASLQAYESLWNSRAQMLAMTGQLLSTMSDVRAAFRTGDPATIQDAAGELWTKLAVENGVLVVTDPQGEVIASLGTGGLAGSPRRLSVISAAARHFPKQASGFLWDRSALYQIAVTPVYVESADGPALIDVLVAGTRVDELTARRLKAATGSEFVFLAQGWPLASTLAGVTFLPPAGLPRSLQVAGVEYAPLVTKLTDVEGKPVGELWVLRSFAGVQQRLAALRRDLFWIWLATMSVGLLATSWLARRIVRPVRELDRAAAEVAKENYSYRVTADSTDELGRLGATFNAMCASLQEAREELIRRERITTIGRFAASVVHDLRNPLAAIYGGAEMLVDNDLPSSHVKRLAGNIYRSSRRMQEMLQDLVNVTGGKPRQPERCRLREIVEAAVSEVRAAAEAQSVKFALAVPDDVELQLDRNRMERVFLNLFSNAIEAMPEGGLIRVSARREGQRICVTVSDSGPGISAQIRSRLFQPFTTSGKKQGLGLGLALSRQTVIDHGGDLREDSAPGQGASFLLTLPVSR